MKRTHTVTAEFKVVTSDTSEVFDPSKYHDYINDVEAQRAAGDLVTLLVPTELGVSVVTVDTEITLTDDEKATQSAYHKAEDNAWHKRYNALEVLGDAHGIKYTTFSMSEVPVEEMNNPLGLGSAFSKIQFVQEGGGFFADGDEESSDYISDVVTNPTMMDAWKAFDDSIEVTKDAHHIFLEGLQPVEVVNNVLLVTFVTGS